tara:strand:- start:3822 stop:5609 length:1788 start_codon:yes stop_codon:yes gene_type:complete
MQAGGEPEESRLSQLFGEQQGVLERNFQPRTVDQADLAREKELSEAQMLFDVAGTALAFATPGSTTMSPAQRLAQAATETQLFDKIGARAATQFASEKADKETIRAEKRDLDLLAFKGAQDQLDRELATPAESRYSFQKINNELIRVDKFTGATSNVYTAGDPSVVKVGDDLVAVDAAVGSAEKIFEGKEKSHTMSPGQQLIDGDGTVIYTAKSEDVIKTVGDYVVNLSDLDDEGNATVLFTKPQNFEVKILNGQLVRYLPGEEHNAEAIFGDAGSETEPEYMVVTDVSSGVKQYVDGSTVAGRAAVVAATNKNKKAGSTIFTVGKLAADKTPTGLAFNTGDAIVLSFDGGRTYTNEQGASTPIPSGSVPVSDMIASGIIKQKRVAARAGDALKDFNATMSNGMAVDSAGTLIGDDMIGYLRDADEAALNGTGPMAKFASFIDATAGSLFGVKFGEATQRDKQFLRALTQMTKTALVLNPRFPVAELNKVEALYPDVDSFFVNPESEVNKLRELKAIALAQYRNNLERLAEGSLSTEIVGKIQSNQHELNRLLTYLSPVDVRVVSSAGSAGSRNASIADLKKRIRDKRKTATVSD